MNACAELFKEYLDSKNFIYTVTEGSDNDIIIDFPYEGKTTRCFFTGECGEYLSLYLLYEHIPEDKIADVIFLCNELNTEYKWVTFYVDKDGDLMIHDDAILSLENAADESFELLVRTINISGEVKSRVMKAIYA